MAESNVREPDLLSRLPLDCMSDEELVVSHLNERRGAFTNLFNRSPRAARPLHRPQDRRRRSRTGSDPGGLHSGSPGTSSASTRARSFSTWIYTIASNLSKNELRNRSRSPVVLFQVLRSRWEDDPRPLQFEGLLHVPDGLYRKRYLKRLARTRSPRFARNTTGWSSACGNSTGKSTTRSPKSPA